MRKGLKRKRPKAEGTYKKAFLKMQRNEAVQVLLAIIAVLGSLYFIQRIYWEYKTGQILKDPAFAVGTITHVGRYITVRFEVADNTYSVKRRVPEELLQGRLAGDTAVVIYEKDDPYNADLKTGF